MFVGVMVVFPCVYCEVFECLVGGGSHLVGQWNGCFWLIFEQRKDKGFSQNLVRKFHFLSLTFKKKTKPKMNDFIYRSLLLILDFGRAVLHN